MRKEYSDLPANQKIIYIKRNIITFTCMFIPMLILIGLLGTTLASYQVAIDSVPESQITNSTITMPKTDTDIWFDYYFAFIMILFFASMSGLITLGSALGDWISDRLNLYTDMNLEGAERRVAEIKKAIQAQDTELKECQS